MLFGDINRQIWQLMFSEGGYWTSAEIAERTGLGRRLVQCRLSRMARTNVIAAQRLEGQNFKRYGVTGTCNVPRGMTIAEVQA